MWKSLSGHAVMQSLQTTHLSGWKRNFQSGALMESAPDGQADVHAPQLTHFESS